MRSAAEYSELMSGIAWSANVAWSAIRVEGIRVGPEPGKMTVGYTRAGPGTGAVGPLGRGARDEDVRGRTGAARRPPLARARQPAMDGAGGRAAAARAPGPGVPEPRSPGGNGHRGDDRAGHADPSHRAQHEQEPGDLRVERAGTGPRPADGFAARCRLPAGGGVPRNRHVRVHREGRRRA